MVTAIIPGLDILQSYSKLASHRVKDIGLESAIAVWTSVIALKITHTDLSV